MLTACILLSVLFVSAVSDDCPKRASLSITTPKRMEALSGSCLQIPCLFSPKSEQEFNSGIKIFGVWIKTDPKYGQNQDNVIFNSSETENKYPMTVKGNLSQKNCTTLFSNLLKNYTDTYFFRIENKAFMATASCDPLQITVTDSPPKPRIEISGDLKEKESVTITCSAPTPCPHSPPQLTWNLQQHPHNIMEQSTDQTFTTKIQENITLSDQHDGYSITCSARYPVNGGEEKTAEETKTLNVSYAPKDTSVSVSPSGLVSAGSLVNLTCSSRAKPPVSRFTWFKKSKDGVMKFSEGPIYSFNVTDVTDVYYCVATNDLGQQESSEIHLDNDGAKQLTSASPWGAVVGAITGIIILICVAAAVWWLKSEHAASQLTQSVTAEETAVQVPTRATANDDIHYGEINFSMCRPEPLSASVQVRGQQEDTLYAQVKVSKPANSLTQTADGLEPIYAQVKKK